MIIFLSTCVYHVLGAWEAEESKPVHSLEGPQVQSKQPYAVFIEFNHAKRLDVFLRLKADWDVHDSELLKESGWPLKDDAPLCVMQCSSSSTARKITGRVI